MKLKIWLTSTAVEPQWVKALVPLMDSAHQCLASPLNRRYELAASPEVADMGLSATINFPASSRI